MRTKDAKGSDMKHTAVFEQNGVHFLRYHNTNVVVLTDEDLILDSGGWQTATTKRRIQQAAELFDLKLGVHQSDHEWWVTLADGEVIPFQDGMKIPREDVTA